MMYFKRAVSVILSAALCIGLLTGIAFAGTDTDDIYQMADALNNLNILQGDSNGDYMLDKNLDRAQSITLIIRMLGKDKAVQQNADELKYTRYVDVPSDAWYAPYVGYGTMYGIVAGDPEGNFTPTSNVTERAFIKMALCALDYEYGVDFDWAGVFQKAYEVGLVIDKSYSTRTQDDNEYPRSKAVEIIYRALNSFKKNTEKKLALTLIDEGVYTSEEIVSSGILGSSESIKFEEIKAVGPDTVEVKFNENIRSLDAKDVTISDAEKEDRLLEVKSLAIKDNRVQIKTAAQTSKKPYDISIKNVVDTNGIISGNLSGTFTGYTSQEVTSDFFMISHVEQVTGKVINIYFTHPVNVGSEIPAYYELIKDGTLVVAGSNQNMVVKKLNSVENAVSIYFKDYTFELGEVYTLRIDGKLNSSYGVKLGEGYGESKEFVATVSGNEQLNVLFVEALTSDSIRIVFNSEVDPTWAGKRLNYIIYDSSGSTIDVTKAVVSESGENSGREVLLSLGGKLYKSRDYEVGIEYIPDVYKQRPIENKKFPFSGDYQSKNELILINAESEYVNSVTLTFNKALDPEKASSTSSYSIRGLKDLSFNVAPAKVYCYEQYGMYHVKLFLPANKTLSDSKEYIAYVYNMKDSLGNSYTGTLREEFTGGSATDTKPLIIDAVTISKDAIKVTFNTEIAFNPTNISTTNYMLEYENNGDVLSVQPYAVNYIDATTLVLRFDELDSDVEYSLRFNSITDYSENYTRTASDEYNAANVRWGS